MINIDMYISIYTLCIYIQIIYIGIYDIIYNDFSWWIMIYLTSASVEVCDTSCLRKSLRKMASGKVNGLGISSPGRASKEESGRRGRRNWEEKKSLGSDQKM